MPDPIFLLLFLLYAWFSPRHNAQILFLKAQVRIMKDNLRRHGISYAVLEPSEKQELMRLGETLDHKVKDIFLINTWQTYQRWLNIERNGGKLKKPGRLRTISQTTRDLIVRMARENIEWGFYADSRRTEKVG